MLQDVIFVESDLSEVHFDNAKLKGAKFGKFIPDNTWKQICAACLSIDTQFEAQDCENLTIDTPLKQYSVLLNGAHFNGADLIETSFVNVDCTGAVFINTTLHNIQCCDTNFTGVNFTSAELCDADFNNVIFDGATFGITQTKIIPAKNVSVDKCSFQHTNFDGLTCSGWNVRHSRFTEAIFKNIKFFQSKLYNVNMSKIQAINLSFNASELANINFVGSVFQELEIKDTASSAWEEGAPFPNSLNIFKGYKDDCYNQENLKHSCLGSNLNFDDCVFIQGVFRGSPSFLLNCSFKGTKLCATKFIKLAFIGNTNFIDAESAAACLFEKADFEHNAANTAQVLKNKGAKVNDQMSDSYHDIWNHYEKPDFMQTFKQNFAQGAGVTLGQTTVRAGAICVGAIAGACVAGPPGAAIGATMVLSAAGGSTSDMPWGEKSKK